MKGYILSSLAGCCGAFASLTGKLITSQLIEGQWIWLARVVLLSLTLLLNAVMWTLFVEAMQYLSASQSLLVNTAGNIFLSAFIGHMFFNEVINFTWSLGATFIVIGLSILVSEKKN